MSDLGEITRCYTLSFTRRSRHSPERLWRAITDPDEIAAWMGHPAKVEVRPGGAWFVDFSRVDGGELDGIVVRAVPARSLVYVWGRSVVEWTIEPSDDGCRYGFVHAGIERRGVEGEEGLAAGWHEFLDQLDRHLDGEPPGDEEQQSGWKALHEPYRVALERVFADTAAS